MKQLLLFITVIISIPAAAQYRSLNKYTAEGPLKVALEYVVEDNMPFLRFGDEGKRAKVSKRYYYAGFDSYADTLILTVCYTPHFVISYSNETVAGFSSINNHPLFWSGNISNISWLRQTSFKECFNFLPMTPPNEAWYFWAFDIKETNITLIYEGYDEMEMCHAIERYLGHSIE